MEMNKKMKMLVVVSLALNLFLAGVIAGSIVRPRHPGFPMMKHGEFAVAREFMQAHRGERESLRNERRSLLEMLKADKFDQAKFDAQMDKVGVMQTEMYKEFMGAMAGKLRELPADERNKKIDRLMKRMGGKHMGRKPGDRREGHRKFEGRPHRAAPNAPEAPDASTSATSKAGK